MSLENYVSKDSIRSLNNLLEQLKSCDQSLVIVWGKRKEKKDLVVDALFQHGINHLESIGILDFFSYGIKNTIHAQNMEEKLGVPLKRLLGGLK